MRAIAQYEQAPDDYVDVHAWYFSPATFRQNINLLRELEYTGLTVSRLYPTLRERNEFWAVLKSSPLLERSASNDRAPTPGPTGSHQ